MHTESSTSRTHYLWLSLFLCITTLVYTPGLTGGFIFDDSHTIYENSHVNPNELSLDSLKRAAGAFAGGGRSISMVSFALNNYFFGTDAYSFKITNLVLHLLNGILIFVLTRLLLSAYNKCNPNYSIPHWTALIITAMWLLNPIQLTTVLYVVQRMAGLASFFILAGLVAYSYGRQRQLEGKNGTAYVLGGIIIGTTLASLCKESGVLLIPYALLIEITFFRFRNSMGKHDLLLLTLLVLMPIAVITYLSLSVYTPDRIIASYTRRDFSFEERILTEARVLWLYIRLILFPDNQSLGIWHDDIEISSSLMFPPTTLPSVFGLLLLLVSGILLLRKHALIGFGILWFFTSHALESSIFALEIAHEHRNYLAAYGVLITAVTLLTHIMRKYANAIPAWIPLLLITFLFALITHQRSQIWSDSYVHAMWEVESHPESPRAVFEAGREQLIRSKYRNPQLRDSGLELIEKAARLDKSGINPNISLMTTAELIEIKQKPWWSKEAARKLLKYPLNPSDIRSLKLLLECQKNGSCKIPHKRALMLFVLAARENDPEGLTLLGFYEANVLERYDYAKDAFHAAILHGGRHPAYFLNYASLLVAGGEYIDAISYLDLAEKHDRYGVYRKRITRVRNKLPEDKINN